MKTVQVKCAKVPTLFTMHAGSAASEAEAVDLDDCQCKEMVHNWMNIEYDDDIKNLDKRMHSAYWHKMIFLQMKWRRKIWDVWRIWRWILLI